MNHYRGVGKHKGRIRAYIQSGGKAIHLGYSSTPEAAARAYDQAAIRLHGDKAKLNFTDRTVTVKEEQIYRLVSPDFFGLTYSTAARLMHMTKAGIYYAIKRMKIKCPQLFPLELPPVGKPFSYRPWMDCEIVRKF